MQAKKGWCNYENKKRFQNACGTGSSFSLDNWMDGFVLSSSRVYPSSIIEISNNATYGQGGVVSQEPVYLSDGSVQIKANLSGLGSGPYYLFVTNNRQETSVAYNLSGTPDTTPLRADGAYCNSYFKHPNQSHSFKLKSSESDIYSANFIYKGHETGTANYAEFSGIGQGNRGCKKCF